MDRQYNPSYSTWPNFCLTSLKMFRRDFQKSEIKIEKRLVKRQKRRLQSYRFEGQIATA